MLSEQLVLSILRASITGAGLVFAGYGLLLPIASKIMGERIEAIILAKKDFKEKSDVDLERATDNQINNIEEPLQQIREKKELPKPLTKLWLIPFLSYLASTILSINWFTNPAAISLHKWIVPFFGFGTISFTILGASSILTISNVLKTEFDKMKIDSKKFAPKISGEIKTYGEE